MTHASSILDAVLGGRIADAGHAFQAALQQKVSDALDLRKVEVAHNLLRPLKEDTTACPDCGCRMPLFMGDLVVGSIPCPSCGSKTKEAGKS